MRNVRIFLYKKDRLKFVSHLDMNRFMTRILQLSKIPFWYTEGFNPHPYLTFALPLSLGFESEYEILDIRVVDDAFTNEMVKESLNRVMPEYIQAYEVCDAVLKAGKIGYAEFKISFSQFPQDLPHKLSTFLLQESIVVEKTGKKGKVSSIDLAPKIKSFTLDYEDNQLVLTLILPAGGADNVNPTLLLDAFGDLPYYRVCRTKVFDTDMNLFK